MKRHITVLRDEAVFGLAIKPDSIVVDATLGGSGHAQEIVAHLGARGTFIGIDADQSAVASGEEILAHAACTRHLTTGNFRNIDSILDHLHIEKVDAILADLGWRMDQFGGNGKGFSFLIDEDLIMTFGPSDQYSFVARDILNEWEEEDIRNVLRGYGEERFAGRIAHAVVERREAHPFVTTFDFVETIKGAVPSFYRHGRLHPATRSFQALRIAVNDEFEALEHFIRNSVDRLDHGGRLAVISFHSLEDRIVKHLFREYTRDQVGVLVTKKPVTPTPEELSSNPRARSAKLRIIEKI